MNSKAHQRLENEEVDEILSVPARNWLLLRARVHATEKIVQRLERNQ